MLVARREPDGSLTVLDQVREMVRLAAGLDEHDYLSAEAQQRALEAMARIRERLRGIPPAHTRVVGTNTFRKARDTSEFLASAGEALGRPIEVVSGVEEARLIHLGVTHGFADDDRRLVVDIGGGSTEVIVGQGAEPLDKASLHIGCVSHSRDYFAEGHLTADHFIWAETAARMELEPIEARLRERDWQHALGASGTVRAVAACLAHSGWSDGTITFDGLTRLRRAMIDAGHIDRLDLPALKQERREVFAGGLAILRAVFEALGIREMGVAQGAMR
ncbi:MAG: Ppx/GppA family phosphatase, partial [Halofilum sp. (in: g-proteobacteria)]